MAMYLPTYVKAPVATPLPYGLMSVVQMPTDEDTVHWKNGIQYQRATCRTAESTIAQCPIVTGFGKDATVTGVQTKGAQPFTVYSSITCSPVGGFWDEAEDRTVSALTDGEARAVERVFWTGGIEHPSGSVIYPHLAADTEVEAADGIVLLQPAATIIATGAVLDIVEAIGLLEGRLADCYGGVGVIHAPRSALAHMSANYLLKEKGQQLQTMGGTPVAFGAGYPGTSPAGVQPPDGTVWLYATGAIALRRSGVTVTSTRIQGLDRSVNTLQLFAERTYVISWDCCLFAAQVSLGGIITGSVHSAT